MAFTRITADTARLGGVPCIRNLRVPVATIPLLSTGWGSLSTTPSLPKLHASFKPPDTEPDPCQKTDVVTGRHTG